MWVDNVAQGFFGSTYAEVAKVHIIISEDADLGANTLLPSCSYGNHKCEHVELTMSLFVSDTAFWLNEQNPGLKLNSSDVFPLTRKLLTPHKP